MKMTWTLSALGKFFTTVLVSCCVIKEINKQKICQKQPKGERMDYSSWRLECTWQQEREAAGPIEFAAHEREQWVLTSAQLAVSMYSPPPTVMVRLPTAPTQIISSRRGKRLSSQAIPDSARLIINSNHHKHWAITSLVFFACGRVRSSCRGRWISEFETYLVSIANSKTARATQRYPVLKKQNKTKNPNQTNQKPSQQNILRSTATWWDPDGVWQCTLSLPLTSICPASHCWSIWAIRVCNFSLSLEWTH